MIGCIVVPANEEKNRWKIDVDNFVNSLQKKWPNAPFRFISDLIPTDIVEWEPRIGQNNLLCVFYKDQQTISMEGGDPNDYAQVALWYRHIVPSQYRLFFADEGNNVRLELHTDTSEREIVEAVRI